MGCASSRQKRCWHCRAPFKTPVQRSYTMHVHHPAQHKGDSYHVVALTSTTLGNLKLESSTNSNPNPNLKSIPSSKGLSSMLEAEVWSKLIEDNIPKIAPRTPSSTPPGEPETINTWELMAGLEDLSPPPPSHFRSFSYDHVLRNSANETAPKPLWVQFQEEEDVDDDDDDDQKSDSVISDFDPEIISSFRRTLAQLPSNNPFRLKPLPEIEKDDCCKVKKDKVVLYFTSLRGVRKTYEDCCDVRMILKSIGVRIDERDVSMHSRFKDELKEAIGRAEGFRLPKVFIGKEYIGGAEEIRQMHEDGLLGKAIEGCEMVDDDLDDIGACETCGDIRFVLCDTCSGSCKVYYDDDDEDEHEHDDDDECEYGFQRCPDCNENGLIRCPICCD